MMRTDVILVPSSWQVVWEPGRAIFCVAREEKGVWASGCADRRGLRVGRLITFYDDWQD